MNAFRSTKASPGRFATAFPTLPAGESRTLEVSLADRRGPVSRGRVSHAHRIESSPRIGSPRSVAKRRDTTLRVWAGYQAAGTLLA